LKSCKKATKNFSFSGNGFLEKKPDDIIDSGKTGDLVSPDFMLLSSEFSLHS